MLSQATFLIPQSSPYLTLRSFALFDSQSPRNPEHMTLSVFKNQHTTSITYEHVANGFICHKAWLVVGCLDSVRAKRGSRIWHTMTEWAGNPSFLFSFFPLSLTHFFSDRLSRVSVGNVRNFLCLHWKKVSFFSSFKLTKMSPLNFNVKVSLLCSHSPPIIWWNILKILIKI